MTHLPDEDRCKVYRASSRLDFCTLLQQQCQSHNVPIECGLPVYFWASSAVHSMRLVGLDIGKMIGRSLFRPISCGHGRAPRIMHLAAKNSLSII